MLCPRCHTENRDNARFCKSCGMHFTSDQGPAAAQPVTAAPIEQQAVTNGANTTAPTQQEQQPGPAVAQNGNGVEDASLEPTRVLSAEEKESYMRHWQQAQQSQQSQQVVSQEQALPESAPLSNGATSSSPEAQANGAASEPTRIPPPPPPESLAANHAIQQVDNVDAAELPTVYALASPVDANSQAAGVDSSAQPTVYAQLPEQNVASDQPTAYAQQPEATHVAGQQEVGSASQPAATDASQQETVYASQADQHDASAQPTVNAQEPSNDISHQETVYGAPVEASAASVPNEAFPVLAIGSTLVGRYEITQVLSETEQEHTYEVVDHQGYQRCWNCGSEQNAEGDEYCIDCGAALLNMTYTLHEYPATESQNKDAHVLPGVIVNTFMENGHTYVIEQPQATQIAFPTGVHLLAASDSDAGDVRRGEPNEDSTLVLQLQRVHESNSSPVGVFIVADGMGGHDNGQGASRMAINVIADRVVNELLVKPLDAEKAGKPQEPLSEDQLVHVFKGSIEEANAAIVQANQAAKTDMGSTITGFMVVNDHAYIINVGDSRTYMLRDGNLYQLTNDHSLVAQLLAGGLIEPDDVYTHPQRSQIFRSLGDKLNTQVDDFKQQVHPGDILLSCSDGLWEMVRNPQITEILSNAPDPQTACTRLIEAANANGGEDNVSAVVVFVR